MPRKVPRVTPGSGAIQRISKTPMIAVPNAKAAAILGGAHMSAETAKAAGQVLSAGVKLLETSVASFGNCFCAFMAYAKEREITYRVLEQEREITNRILEQEREITRRVVAVEREATARVEAWSAAVVVEAETRTEEVRVLAETVLANFLDRAAERDAKMQVIHRFLDEYAKWNTFVVDTLSSRTKAMPLAEREDLNSHIGMLLQRASEMQNAITNLAQSL